MVDGFSFSPSIALQHLKVTETCCEKYDEVILNMLVLYLCLSATIYGYDLGLNHGKISTSGVDMGGRDTCALMHDFLECMQV